MAWLQPKNAGVTGLRQPLTDARSRIAPSSASAWLSSARVRAGAADWTLATLAMVVAGWLRWSGLGRQSLWVDEMSSFGLADNGLRHIIPNILANDGHPPLYIIVVHLAHFTLRLGTVDSVRVPSLLAGILTVGVVYALARILVGRLAAILSTALAVVSPLLVWYSREGRMYALTWLFVMLSFLALVQAVRTRRRPWLFLYAILIAASLYTDISAVMALVPQAIVVAWFLFRSHDDARAWWLRIGAVYLAGWLLFSPWLAVLPRQLPLLHATFAGYEPSLGTVWRLVLNVTGLAAAYATLDDLQVPVALAALLVITYGAALIGAVWLGRDHRLFTAVALSLALGPAVMGALFLGVGSQGVLLPRVMGLTVFGLVLALGGTAELAWRALRPRRLALATMPAAALIAVATTTLSLTNVEARGSNGQNWRAPANLVTQRAQPGDALIYYPYGLKYMVDAYLPPTSPWTRDGVGLWASTPSVADAQFAKWAAGHPHVWFVFYASGGIDMPVHDAWLRANGYQRIGGDPTAPLGVLEYSPVDGSSP